MRQSAAGRRFYRLVRTNPPTEDDFVPQGQRPNYTARAGINRDLRAAIMNGVSVFDTEQAARAQDAVFATRTSGSPFRFIATLHIPGDSSVECDDAFGNKHHWDLYASPPELLARVAVQGIEL